MTRNIDEQIRTFYTQQALSPEALGRLRNLIEKPEAPPAGTNVRMWQTLAMAATVALAFLAGVLFVARTPTTTSPAGTTIASTDASNRIAQEVAMRHHSCTHSEFTAADLDELAPQMTNLDFPLTSPSDVDLSTLKLQGAHYCVLNGQLALHATYIDSQGNTVSLLETRSSSQLASLRHAMHEIDDVEVEMWQKNDVIIAVARPIEGTA